MPKVKKFVSPKREPDTVINFDDSFSEYSLQLNFWFKELIYIYKIKSSEAKRFKISERGYIDRVSSLHGAYHWVTHCENFGIPKNKIKSSDNYWVNDFSTFYQLFLVEHDQSFEIETKLEKAYDSWLFQESLENALKT